MFAWSKPSEQAPAEGASPSEVARYVEDLYGEFLWELADTEKKAFLHGLCKQKGWRLNDVARCLGQGPLAVVAGDVSPVKDAADQPNPVAVGVVASPFQHAEVLFINGASLVEVTIYLQSAGCHLFDIGRFLRSRGVTTEELHHAVRGVLQTDLPDVLRGMVSERPALPFPEALPTFDGSYRQKLEVTEPATHLLARSGVGGGRAEERAHPARHVRERPRSNQGQPRGPTPARHHHQEHDAPYPPPSGLMGPMEAGEGDWDHALGGVRAAAVCCGRHDG